MLKYKKVFCLFVKWDNDSWTADGKDRLPKNSFYWQKIV